MFTETIVEVSTEPRVELFVARSGGPADRALLVIHGGPDWDHTYLRDPLAEMAGRIQLIMPDIRGCGRSTCGLASDYYTPEAVVSDLAVLLGQLGLTCADVLGFSYGGLLAQRLAISHPSLVRRLIIASSSICPVPPDAYDAWPERDAHRAAEAAVWASPGQPTAALVRAAAVAGAPANIWREEKLPSYLSRLSAVRFTAEWVPPWRSGILPPARPSDSALRLKELDIPILLLHGARDMIFPASLAAKAASAIPAAEAVILEDAGHMAHVDQPSRWLVAVMEFLAR